MPSLHDLLTAVREAANREPDTMVSLALRSDDAKWCQILPDKINLAYPFDKPPLEAFAEFGTLNSSNIAIGFWEPFIFADFDTASMSIAQVEDFLTSYLVAVFGSADPDEYAVSFEVALRGTIAADSDDEFLRKIVQLKRHFEGRSSHKP